MAKAFYIGVPNAAPIDLPSGYTQLEYIESTGTQYIDTGISVPHASEKIIIEFAPMDVGYDNAIAGHDAPEWSWATNVSMVLNSNILVANTTVPSVSLDTFCKFEYTSTYAKINDGTAVTLQSLTYTDGYNNTLFYASTKYGKHKVRSYKLYNGSTLVRDLVPCINPNGEAGMYDLVNGKFYGNAGTGTFTVGVVGSFARKAKKTYIGINNIARKIKKIYIGVAGVARLFFSGQQKLSYYGTATALSVGRQHLRATTVGNYALFCGGDGGNYNAATYKNTVDAYSASLTRSTPTALSTTTGTAAATSVGNYALIGGGYNGSTRLTTVNTYNTSLTRGAATALSAGRNYLAATTVGNYAIFGGGVGALTTVDAYNTSLTRSTPTAFGTGRSQYVATTVGNYALFGGGYNSSKYYDVVEAYNASLTKSIATALSLGRYRFAATTVGNYALFGGGVNLSTFYATTVDAYDTSLTRSTPTELSVGASDPAATTVGDFALFGGGYSSFSNVVNAYDTSLTRSIPANMSVKKSYHAATAVGNYALFGGGCPVPMTSSSSYLSAVDVYMVD